MDWMLPGVPATAKESSFALGLIQFQAAKLALERFYWEQATVLSQLGILDHPVAAAGLERGATSETSVTRVPYPDCLRPCRVSFAGRLALQIRAWAELQSLVLVYVLRLRPEGCHRRVEERTVAPTSAAMKAATS